MAEGACCGGVEPDRGFGILGKAKKEDSTGSPLEFTSAGAFYNNKYTVNHLSMYLFPLSNLESMTKIMRKFFWQGNAKKKKYYLVKWNLNNKPKSKGGLGIKDLKLFNVSLLCKWW